VVEELKGNLSSQNAKSNQINEITLVVESFANSSSQNDDQFANLSSRNRELEFVEPTSVRTRVPGMKVSLRTRAHGLTQKQLELAFGQFEIPSDEDSSSLQVGTEREHE